MRHDLLSRNKELSSYPFNTRSAKSELGLKPKFDKTRLEMTKQKIIQSNELLSFRQISFTFYYFL